jgi:3-oxoacyl-[acyl-carrier protein] reductase
MIPIDLSGKTALITGGTRGIGRSIALLLAEAGASTACVYRSDAHAAARSLAERSAFGARHANVQADVATEEGIGAVVSWYAETFGDRLDILIPNAAAGARGPVTELALADWHRILDTNMTSAFLLTKALAPKLPPGGSIIAIASGAGHVGLEGLAAYGASKAGLIRFCEAISQDLGPAGIRVNVVSPGHTDTSFFGKPSHDHKPRESTSNALARVGVPYDVASAVLFFASDLSAFVTGQALRVNGGVV